jgi:tubulin polyglutamylase TTLL6/13
MVGFDILIDKNMKPYVLEINNTPSMAPHTDLENKIKKDLLHDLFQLVDYKNDHFFELNKIVEEKWNMVQEYVFWPF